MNRFFKAFKDLYNCESPLKRHLFFVLLVMFPAFVQGIIDAIDKSMPKEIIIVLFLLLVIASLFAFIPNLILAGNGIEFIKVKLKGGSGLPMINLNQIITFIKAIPILFVWSLYFLIFTVVVYVIPIICCIAFLVQHTGNAAGSSAVLASVLSILFLVFYSLLYFVIVAMFTPFFSYVFYEYVESDKYEARFFNPMTFCKYLKAAFKDTIFTFFKVLGGVVIGSFISGIALAVFFGILFTIGILYGVSVSEAEVDNISNSPLFLMITIILSTLYAIFASYLNYMISYAAIDLYVEVYKKIPAEAVGKLPSVE